MEICLVMYTIQRDYIWKPHEWTVINISQTQSGIDCTDYHMSN